jgi:5-methylcytosine-specific restriction endonuclease McrA
MPIIYGRGRYPKLIAERVCRGCHNPVPSNRQTWCSKECYEKYEPLNVKIATAKRDNGICQRCGLDINAAYTAWRKAEPDRCIDWNAWCKHHRLEPKPEYDHIIPFCEGGLTVLENMRTLCVECHRKVTKEFHKRRAEARIEKRNNTRPDRGMGE